MRYVYNHTERQAIMSCIHRLNGREHKALDAAVLHQGGANLPKPYLRSQLRAWFRLRWEYLIREYEKVTDE